VTSCASLPTPRAADVTGVGSGARVFEGATLAQYEQVLGASHPDTLRSRDHLAHARQVATTVQQPGTR
jgi:hypothetical protein